MNALQQPELAFSGRSRSEDVTAVQCILFVAQAVSTAYMCPEDSGHVVVDEFDIQYLTDASPGGPGGRPMSPVFIKEIEFADVYVCADHSHSVQYVG